MFFNKFGKCKKKEDGVCPYIHDKDKVAVCRKFLQGNCFKEHCLLSHKVAPEKMPSCKFYLEGLCTKDPCPYRHVKVNDSAQVCPDFLKGFCPLYDKCLKRHENPVPEKHKKPAPPMKPKRKSLGHPTPVINQDKKKRYFEVDEAPKDETAGHQLSENLEESFEKKRQRLLKKIELAKQGWTGVAMEKPSSSNEFLDDSGPYEEIDEDEIEVKKFSEPLPAFISLTTETKEDEKDEAEEFEERLI